MTLSPCRTVHNVIQTQKCESCQLNKLFLPFPAGGTFHLTKSQLYTSSTHLKVQAWPQFNLHPATFRHNLIRQPGVY